MDMMRDATISFPMFGEGFSINPSATYELFGRTFYWYGAIIALGFLLAVIYCTKRCGQFGIKPNDIIDMLIFTVPAAIIGARLYYVVFNFSDYQGNFWNVFKIWNGGLAIYGAIIFATITVIIFCRVKKISAGAFMDMGAFGLLIGQTVGRWANFINREAHGGVTDIFCRMGLTQPGGETIFVHPTFLYESLWNLVGFIALHFYSKKSKRRYDWQIFLLYIGWYGLGRMLIEGLRTDSLYLFSTEIRVSQLLAGLSVMAVIFLLIILGGKKHSPEDLWVNKVKALESAADSGPAMPVPDETDTKEGKEAIQKGSNSAEDGDQDSDD